MLLQILLSILNSNHVAANSVRKIHEGEPNTMSLIRIINYHMLFQLRSRGLR